MSCVKGWASKDDATIRRPVALWRNWTGRYRGIFCFLLHVGNLDLKNNASHCCSEQSGFIFPSTSSTFKLWLVAGQNKISSLLLRDAKAHKSMTPSTKKLKRVKEKRAKKRCLKEKRREARRTLFKWGILSSKMCKSGAMKRGQAGGWHAGALQHNQNNLTWWEMCRPCFRQGEKHNEDKNWPLGHNAQPEKRVGRMIVSIIGPCTDRAWWQIYK